MPMIQAFISSQRAAATAVAFILTYFVALTLGRFFKRRAQVPLGLFFQTFCLTLAFYAAITVYGVQADWRKHVGAALVLLSPPFIIAFANHYLWDFYFEKKRQTPIPHILREIFALLVFLITLLLVLSFGYHAEAQLKGLLAGSGIVAIILGFAGQNLFGGIIAGIQLQISRPFRVGDCYRLANASPKLWRSTGAPPVCAPTTAFTSTFQTTKSSGKPSSICITPPRYMRCEFALASTTRPRPIALKMHSCAQPETQSSFFEIRHRESFSSISPITPSSTKSNSTWAIMPRSTR